jgi:hypothetical protein
MPVNTYFNSFNNGVQSEQDLYEDLIIESIQIYGFDAYYLPRDIIEEDDILNEEVLSKFDEAYQVEMYLKEIEGFEGEDLLSKFGLQVTDSCTLVVAVKRWNELVQQQQNDIDQGRPFEGDLIYFPFSKTLFEVRFVEDQVPFFRLNDLPVYELQCELFRYESQDLDTGIEEIDQIEGIHADITNVYVTVTSGTFTVGEKLTLTTPAGITILAEYVKSLTTDSGIIFSLSNITYPAGEFIHLAAGTSVSGDTSAAVGIIGNVIGLDDGEYPSTTNDQYEDNSSFKDAGFNFIDFSEENPFGEL